MLRWRERQRHQAGAWCYHGSSAEGLEGARKVTPTAGPSEQASFPPTPNRPVLRQLRREAMRLATRSLGVVAEGGADTGGKLNQGHRLA